MRTCSVSAGGGAAWSAGRGCAGLRRPLWLLPLPLPPLRMLPARLLCVRRCPRRPGHPPCCLHRQPPVVSTPQCMSMTSRLAWAHGSQSFELPRVACVAGWAGWLLGCCGSLDASDDQINRLLVGCGVGRGWIQCGGPGDTCTMFEGEKRSPGKRQNCGKGHVPAMASRLGGNLLLRVWRYLAWPSRRQQQALDT